MKTLLDMKLILALTLVAVPFPAFSLTPAPHAPYKIYSPNKKFFVQMTPQHEGYEPTEYQGKAYAVDSDQVLWSFNGDRGNLILCDDGIHLIRSGSYASLDDQFSGLAIGFYQSGRELKSYQVKDLLKNPKALKKSDFGVSGSGYLWRTDVAPHRSKLGEAGLSPDGTRYTLYLTDGSGYVFDVASGAIVEKK